MENPNIKKGGDNIIWRNAILVERERPPQALLTEAVNYVENKNNALILGDACQVNSKYLIEEIGFQEVDNVDYSPTLLDGYYDSPKMKKFKEAFEDFNYPKDTYDFIYGKSLSFVKKEHAKEVIERLTESLHIGSIFSAIFYLPEQTFIPSHGIWTRKEIEELFNNTGLSYLIDSKEINRPSINLLGESSNLHQLEVIMRKD